MTDSQFNYSGLTLEELRTLAASPQVGAMEAMPHAFRHLADRVGEVAELLSRAQADLPNWWKGPAAEQAAAALGRAAAEAHEFHGSALSAATAVSRCATIVAEQQHQMMNIPELPEPGVTAVIERPKTPMEALEAARQDAAYHAAHEQAVQVVNGIAAQYVETREHLANVSVLLGENFHPATTVHGSLENEEKDGVNSTSTRRYSSRADGLQDYRAAKLLTDTDVDASPVASPRSQERVSKGAIESFAYENRSYVPSSDPVEPATYRSFAVPSTKREHLARQKHSRSAASSKDLRDTQHESSLRGIIETSKRDSSIRSIQGSRQPAQELGGEPGKAAEAGKVRETQDNREARDYMPEPGAPLHGRGYSPELEVQPLSYERQNPVPIESIRPSQEATPPNGEAESHQSNYYFNADRDHAHTPIGEGAHVPFPEREYAYGETLPSPNTPVPPAIESPTVGASATTTYPPFGSFGPARHERSERNTRPAYLKERKSAWLSEVIAAPPDGIITPDWHERSQQRPS